MTFKHPEFLWGFLLLIIPLAVHLLQFRRRKKILFPGVFRLIEALQISQKQRNIRFWFLFSLRTLFISILTLAFAQPHFPDELSNQVNHWVIVYDNSSSMFLPNNQGETGNQEAQEILQDWLKSQNSSVTFTLITHSDEVGWVDALDIRRRLGLVSKDQKNLSLPQLLSKSNLWISRAAEQGNQCRVLVVSDFQSDFTSWNSASKAPVNCKFLKVGRSSLEGDEINFSLDTVFRNADGSQLKAQVSLHSTNQIQAVATVRLKSNGSIKAQKVLQFNENLSNSADQPISKMIEFNLMGMDLDSFVVEIDGDEFKADNHLFGTIPSQEKIKVFINPKFEGISEMQRLLEIQPERFQLVSDAAKADWIIDVSALQKLNSYEGSARRMIFLDKSAMDAQNDLHRLAPDFLQLPQFEGLLTRDLDDKSPLPEVSVNVSWATALFKQYDPVIQTENRNIVLFQKEEADRLDYIWAADWKEGLGKFRRSVWFLPIISQLMYGNSSGINAVYTLDNGWFALNPKWGLNTENTVKIYSKSDTTKSWLANIQGISKGLGVQFGGELDQSGFHRLSGSGFILDWAVNIKNNEFKVVNNGIVESNLDHWKGQDVEIISTKSDLLSLNNFGDNFQWTDTMLYAALLIILMESLVLYNMFRTKSVNSQKQA